MSDGSVIRIPPYFFIHVLDSNTNVTSVVLGPQTYTRPDHVRVVYGPERMITIPPRHWIRVANPVRRDENGEPCQDHSGQFKLRYGDEAIMFSQEPFPLYPGESVVGAVEKLQVRGEFGYGIFVCSWSMFFWRVLAALPPRTHLALTATV